MPKFEVTGRFKIEVTAEDPDHALKLTYPMTLSDISTKGELETDEPDLIPRDVEGEKADRHWNRVKEGV